MKQQYNKINNLVGWITFVIAAFTYCMTIEPTASFWDCPEFITTGYKLEVGHPPGAPFFMLTANLFSQFASDPSQVAMMVNIMSALMSAACILFLFWSITHLTRKLICPDLDQLTKGKLISIMGAGVVGALAYTWSDTFWFSAVEGEVYAYSSLFTAIVFWLILKWENRADEPHSDRWLILIAYLTGLSIGVHLLNLLILPHLHGSDRIFCTRQKPVFFQQFSRSQQKKNRCQIKQNDINNCLICFNLSIHEKPFRKGNHPADFRQPVYLLLRRISHFSHYL